jgi:hypothetical protein
MPTMTKANRAGVLRAVADQLAMSPEDFTASRAPQGSIHDGLWYVSEREDMPIDDCCWIVLPDNAVARGIPVSNPIHEPSTSKSFARNPIRRTKVRL